jgi:dimethylaniline monooxygenase (N-oxide forming)
MAMDVCIIGAGWSGIYACKYALENGLNPIVLERRPDIGGVWNYSDDPAVTTVMKSTISSSSRIVTEASDFFMDESVGHFMHHEEVMKYLRDYIAHFGLGKYLNFGCHVTQVEKQDGVWEITYEQNGERKVIQANKLAVCAGLHNRKKPVTQPVSDFSGTIIHAGDIKQIQPDDFSAEDRVLVYGGGETASDIIDLLVKTPARITWAIRGGQHFLRKTAFHQRKGPGLYGKHDFALDLIASPVIAASSPFKKGAPGRRYIADFLSTGTIRGYHGHGVPLWRNQHRYGQQFFNKNGHSVEHVTEGRITPQNDIVAVNDDRVHFKSGAAETFTHIICCYGYQFHCPFLPDPWKRGELERFYHFVFAPDDPSLAFLGFARPIIGSIPVLTEMQCLWVFRVWSGKAQLPSAAEMAERQVGNNRRWDERLPGRGNLRTLVHPSTYVAHMIKSAYPERSPGDVFRKHPLRGLKFLTWIPSASMRHAFDPELDNQEFNRLWRRRRHGVLIGWILPAWVVMGRLLQIEKLIDWHIMRFEKRRQDRLAKLKMRAKPLEAETVNVTAATDSSEMRKAA